MSSTIRATGVDTFLGRELGTQEVCEHVRFLAQDVVEFETNSLQRSYEMANAICLDKDGFIVLEFISFC